MFRTQLSYYPDDLVVTEWNVALVVDDVDYADTVNVLEHLNVQLLELRYYDDVLDRFMSDAFARATAPPRGLPLLHRPYRRAVTELTAIRLDVAGIVERVHNALKLSGDLYLAKVYTRTAERLALRAWEESVGRKLDVLEQIHNLLLERATTARGEALELTIIVLIVMEIALLLGRLGVTWPGGRRLRRTSGRLRARRSGTAPRADGAQRARAVARPYVDRAHGVAQHDDLVAVRRARPGRSSGRSSRSPARR